ncbi:MAG TPA: GNAT family N-acetyltransferase [Flavobacteriales bacterium]|nr:GNAT family N-acetyltransferase [Flavobacteriales bacterium]
MPIPSLEGLVTERLYFRPLTTADMPAWMPFITSPEAMRFLGRALGNDDACRQWFDRQLGRYAAGEGGLYAVVDRSTGTLLGQAGLLVQQLEGVHELEVGYHFLPEVWGRGYATEAARACMDRAFALRLAPSLISMVHTANERSARVARRNGLIWERQVTFRELPVDIFRIHTPHQ